MATSRRGMRSTRKLRDWTVEQVESEKFPGLVWDDPPAKTMFRIPWKHAGKHEFRQDEDAAFFKAWAIFKGKYNPGECSPATWKTRIRCALSKSPEFEEVPSRSRLDITEPYKVYRLVPILEQILGKKPKKQKTKQVKIDFSSSRQRDVAKSPTSEAMMSHASSTFNPHNYRSGQVNPQAAEPAPEAKEIVTHTLIEPGPAVGIATRPNEDFSLCMSVSYVGEPLCRYLLPEGEFLISSVPTSLSSPASCLKRVVLPSPAKMVDGMNREIIRRLLKGLAKGIMVATNHEGIFIQCRGETCILWSGFSTPEGQIKLENNTHQQLFKAHEFRSALEQYQKGLGPLPDHRVILYVGDELDENGHRDCKPIIIQLEQTFAIRLRSSSGSP